MSYSYARELTLSFNESVIAVKKALSGEGFGVLTEIDVQDTLQRKLGTDFERYIILGACNPRSAHQALLAEHDIGLMLPCNVIVHEHQGKSRIAAILPTVAMSIIDNPELQKTATRVEEKLIRAIDSILVENVR